jgi:hypothetical protein
MLRRRPAAVYEMLAEDELLERSQTGGEPGPQPDDGAVRGHRREPVTAAAASTLGPPPATGRRTLLVALTAAALVGFAVWELLGIASDSAANRPGTPFQGLRQEVSQSRRLGRRESPAPAERSRPATRSLHQGRPAAGETRVPAGMPAAPAAPVSSPLIQPGRSAMPAAPISAAPTTSIPFAEQEFGFER